MDDTRFGRALAEWADLLDARRGPLPDPVRTLYQRILLHFADTGEPPSPGTLRTWSTQLDIDAREALALLVTFDLVEADPTAARVWGAYPFAAQFRGHRVRIDGGPIVQAYCAIDALGIPAMLGRDVTITSHDPHTGEQIRIEVRDGQATWQPPDAAASVPTSVPASDGGGEVDRQAAETLCPTVNFYGNAEVGRAYEREHGLNLEILTIPQALRAGAASFGLLSRLGLTLPVCVRRVAARAETVPRRTTSFLAAWCGQRVRHSAMVTAAAATRTRVAATGPAPTASSQRASVPWIRVAASTMGSWVVSLLPADSVVAVAVHAGSV